MVTTLSPAARPLNGRERMRAHTAKNAAHLKPKYQYFNETGNDRWIAEYVFPGKTGGYFVEAGAAKWGKEIAFTQSYWASMQRPTEPWDGPIPLGVS